MNVGISDLYRTRTVVQMILYLVVGKPKLADSLLYVYCLDNLLYIVLHECIGIDL